jgi:hypothetical protein
VTQHDERALARFRDMHRDAVGLDDTVIDAGHDVLPK